MDTGFYRDDLPNQVLFDKAQFSISPDSITSTEATYHSVTIPLLQNADMLPPLVRSAHFRKNLPYPKKRKLMYRSHRPQVRARRQGEGYSAQVEDGAFTIVIRVETL